MTAFAQLLRDRAIAVSGSDTHEVFFTDEVLRHLDIPFVEGFDAHNVPEQVDIVVTSPAYINTDNPEIIVAQKRAIPVITWHDGLAELFNAMRGIAVAGTHGKSTTTAMLGVILERAGFDPTVVVGSRVNEWGSNARVGASQYFVLEADEYRDAFLRYDPEMILLTSVDYDHPDYFPTRDSYMMSFKIFTDRVERDLLIRVPDTLEHFALALPGQHNQKNANLAAAAARKLGVNDETIHEALVNFKGLARRFEHYGVYNGAELYDDYAHHPTEIAALLSGIREKFPNKEVCMVFQPHTFSRTKGLFDDFVKELAKVDRVAILKTYSSAREQGKDELGKKLAATLRAEYFATNEEAIRYYKKNLSGDRVLFSVGAGDSWQIVQALAQ